MDRTPEMLTVSISGVCFEIIGSGLLYFSNRVLCSE